MLTLSSLIKEHLLEEQRTPMTGQVSVPEEAEWIDQRSPTPFSDANAHKRPNISTSNEIIENTPTKQTNHTG